MIIAHCKKVKNVKALVTENTIVCNTYVCVVIENADNMLGEPKTKHKHSSMADL